MLEEQIVDKLLEIAKETQAGLRYFDDSEILVTSTEYVIESSEMKLKVIISKTTTQTPNNKYIKLNFKCKDSSSPFVMQLKKSLFTFLSRRLKFNYMGDKESSTVSFFKNEISKETFVSVKKTQYLW